MTVIKNVTASAAGRDSDLEAGSANEGITALQMLTCQMSEAALTAH